MHAKGAINEKKELGNHGPDINKTDQTMIPYPIDLERDRFFLNRNSRRIITASDIANIIFGTRCNHNHICVENFWEY